MIFSTQKNSPQPHESAPGQLKATPEQLFEQKRRFFKQMATGSVSLAAMSYYPAIVQAKSQDLWHNKFKGLKRTYSVEEEINNFEEITSYNNFYELGTGKDDPVRLASALKPSPWSIRVEGECESPGTYSLDEILDSLTFEERVYRFRCVEAWSMVIPWTGFELSALIKQLKPTEKAKYVAFETVYDRKNPLPGQKRNSIDWPYREGLRMDEAMHPLTFMATGLYGKPLPNQNGAPIRLVVPWKYGFKSIKSIVKIRFSKKEPKTSWNMLAPREYGFYSNVNPQVNHPRWSQKRERRIGEFFKRETLMFNGYQEEVAHLYKDMDLSKYY